MHGRKNILFYLLFIVALSIQETTYAQFITLPDPNFAAHIASAYPAAINGSNQLDTNVAKTINGTFNAINKNINDVSGIEYFINIDRLYLTSNNLTFLPSLDRLTQLTRLYVDSNQLTAIPDLHALTNLIGFQCHNNKITALPSMANMNSIQQFFCHRNLLTSLPDITGMTSLNHFICSDNFITSLPDMSTLTSLNRFLCTNNKLTSVDLTSIPNVTQVHLRNNGLENFPNINGMTQLTEFQVDGNKFTSLPDLSTFVNLTYLRISNNYLTFEDLLPLTTLPGFAGFQISPQNLIGAADTSIVKEKNTFTFSAGVDLTLTSNTYTWFKNGIQIGTSSTPIYTIPVTQFSDAGQYTFEIQNSNPLLASLVLKSNILKVEVIYCMDISQLRYTSTQESCKSPIVFSCDESYILNAVTPITYTLSNVLTGKSTQVTQSSFEVPHAGLYQLTIRDASNCSMTYPQNIELNKRADCNPVIYPDEPGVENGYFLDFTGKAIIYAVSGQKVRELTLPAYWDGKDYKGTIVDTGLYNIAVNDHTLITISVLRTK